MKPFFAFGLQSVCTVLKRKKVGFVKKMRMLCLYGAISSPASSSRVLLHTNQNCAFPVFQTKPARRGCRVLSMNQGPAGNAAEEDGSSRKAGDDAIAQYVVIRKDLVDSLKWPLGSVLAQACHAAVAAVWIFRDHPDTIQYCDKLDSMTTVSNSSFSTAFYGLCIMY